MAISLAYPLDTGVLRKSRISNIDILDLWLDNKIDDDEMYYLIEEDKSKTKE